MKKYLLASVLITLISCLAHAQDTLFTENFETSSSSFALNTTDVSSTPSGYNYWIRNNAYTGGSGQIVCIGFPFTFTVPVTPDQPAGITGSPNSYYLHTVSDAAITNGVSNCCFLAADGVCNNAERYFLKMNSDVNTAAYDTVSVSFWWICRGGNNSFGEVYYSIDGGNNWIIITAPVQKYNNNQIWTLQTISIPEFAGQTTLRFGYRFVNQVAANANDPGFGIDDIIVTGIVNTTGIEIINHDDELLSLSANPSSDGIFNLTVKNSFGKKVDLKVVDITGRIVYRENFENNQNEIKFSVDLKNKAAGIYYLRLTVDNKTLNKKLLLTK